MVTGCATSVAATAPKTPPVPTPTTVARPDVGLEPVVGRMLALKDLLDQTATLVNSAFAAEAEQLPATVQADYSDAHGRLTGAFVIAGGISAPGKYVTIDTLLGKALVWYSRAVDDGARQPAQSLAAATRGHTSLLQAENLLQTVPEAGQQQTLVGEQSALALAFRSVPHPKPQRHTPRHPTTHRSRSTHSRRPVSAAHHIISHIPIFTAHRVRPASSRREPRATTPRPTDTPTPAPTATATPPPTVRPLPVIHLTPHRDSRLAHYLKVWHAGTRTFGPAFSAVRRCAAVLAGINAGRDLGGTSTIAHCLSLAGDRLRTLAARLHHASDSLVHTPAALSLVAAERGLKVARAGLARALTDARSINLGQAELDLTSAAMTLDSARHALLAAREALRQAP